MGGKGSMRWKGEWRVFGITGKDVSGGNFFILFMKLVERGSGLEIKLCF